MDWKILTFIMHRLSIISPTLQESAFISATLSALQPLRTRGHEVIVVDGGSTDTTCDLARPLADAVLCVDRGRARQMNAGAKLARGDVLWFLHADTMPPQDADHCILEGLAGGYEWGRFDVRLSGNRLLLRGVERTMNRRSRLTGIATGDQAIFVKRALFVASGGFPDIELMEDIAFTRTLKRSGRPCCLHEIVITSSRRWETNGLLRTILLMGWLRLAYAAGAKPARLSRYYRQ